MKNINKIFLGLGMLAAFSACKKYKALDYEVDKPESIVAQEDLDSYPPLKSYINRTAHPNFKWGTALSLPEYTSRGVKYRLANKNFDEIVLGYEMKHGAVVKNDGTMSFDQINELLNNAQVAGATVYGHTLCWHANQNATYLKTLVAPIIIPGVATPTWDLVSGANFETDAATNYQSNAGAVLSFTATGQGANGTGRALKITNDAVRTNDWDAQFFFKFDPATKAGEEYELTMDVRSDAPATFPTQAHTAPGAYKHWDFFGGLTTTTTWTKYTKRILVADNTSGCNTIAFNLGKTATNFYFDNITVKKYNAKGSGNAGYAYTFSNTTVGNFWNCQIAQDLAAPLENSKEYTLKFVAKASKAGSIRAELQSTSNYSSNSYGTFALTVGWKEYELKTTTSAADRNRLVFSFGDFDGQVYIDNVKVTPAGSTTSVIANGDFEAGETGWGGWGTGSSRGRTPEGQGYGGAGDIVIEKTAYQKDSIINIALDKFIAGMSAVTKGKVKAWDVVNEPMDDGKPYELKTGIGRTNLAADEFYWQDYLGKDYAVKAFKMARQYGNPTDIHFINDYNLEYNLDKCKGIIEYVKYIESKGAKVDGIGTQMHISTTANKDNIVEMFKLLAATGKLVKISELDIGVGVKTADATPAHYQAQAEMYKFVIDKYFELIPAPQRYGITIWSPTDSPLTSSWRAGEPIGLWTETYVRKLAFAAVAKALEANMK